MDLTKKQCNTCKQWLGLPRFAKGSGRDGLQYKCRGCFHAYYRKDHPKPPRQTAEERAAKDKAYRESRKAQKAEYDRQRRARLADQLKEEKRAYYLRNAERLYQQTLEWRRANPDLYRSYMRKGQSKRNARKLAQWVEDVDPQVVWERDSGICHICGDAADPQNWHLEHIRALANGGEHSYANTAVSHPTCNLKKGARETWEPKTSTTLSS